MLIELPSKETAAIWGSLCGSTSAILVILIGAWQKGGVRRDEKSKGIFEQQKIIFDQQKSISDQTASNLAACELRIKYLQDRLDKEESDFEAYRRAHP